MYQNISPMILSWSDINVQYLLLNICTPDMMIKYISYEKYMLNVCTPDMVVKYISYEKYIISRRDMNKLTWYMMETGCARGWCVVDKSCGLR